ncbi:MAG: NAD(P)-dependent oxidoreductase [Thermoguttaceae bacterium]
MNRKVVIITGAAGFLGSAVTVDLSGDHTVVAIDHRGPSEALLAAAPGVGWHQVDIAEARAVEAVFRQTTESIGRVDLVVHFAAFYHFGMDRREEYERTNVQGTSHVVQSSVRSGVGRLIFASSIAAMRPESSTEVLTEKTPTADYIPYAETKAIGERMLREASDRLPAVVLRIGGAFSDWCELPPLWSLLKLWGGRSPLSRLVVGQGRSAMPYIHRDDLVRIVRACIERHASLGHHEVFLASQQGAVTHEELFTAIGRTLGKATTKPIFFAPGLAKLGLAAQHALGHLTGRVPFEHPWMLQFTDRPWVADTTHTWNELGFRPTDGLGLLERLPVLLEHFRHDRRTWEDRNRVRAAGRYAYSCEDT